jgi:hypothetical protein
MIPAPCRNFDPRSRDSWSNLVDLTDLSLLFLLLVLGPALTTGIASKIRWYILDEYHILWTLDRLKNDQFQTLPGFHTPGLNLLQSCKHWSKSSPELGFDKARGQSKLLV